MVVPRLQDPMDKDVLHAQQNPSVAAQTTRHPLMDHRARVAVSIPRLDAARTILVLLGDRMLRVASVPTRPTAVVPTRKHPHVDPSRRAVHVKLRNMVAVPTRSPLPRDPSSRVARARQCSSVAVPMASPSPRDHRTRAAIAPRPSSSAVRMARPLPRDPTSRVALAWRPNTVVVPTVLQRHWMPSSVVVRMFESRCKSPVVYPKIRVPAATLASSTTSTPTMEVVRVSGMAAVVAMTIASRPKPNARTLVRNTRANISACCPRVVVAVHVPQRNGTSTRSAIVARNSHTVDAMEPTIDSTARNSVSTPARLPISCVSWGDSGIFLG